MLFRSLVHDLTSDEFPKLVSGVDLWHDRAVLHFLTEERQQVKYIQNLDEIVNKGGYVLIATFALNGASKCSGLDIKRYSVSMLEEFLGSKYELLQSHDYIYIMPNGSERPYVYTLFKRIQ